MTAPLVSTTDRPFQLLPPLTVEQRDLLRQSIKENGVLEPVVFDEDGEILDGHHRVEIAEELGIEYPRRVIDDLDRPGKHMYALTVNVARRQLDQAARSGLVAQMRIRGMSIREIAKATGMSVGKVHKDLQVFTDEHLPEKVTGADGKSYAATRPAPEPVAAHPSWPTEAELKPWETLAPQADRVAESMEPVADDPRDRTHGAEFESYDAAESLVPAPIAQHYETSAWKGGQPGECGIECACGTTYDGFDSLAEAAAHLARHIELSELHTQTPGPAAAPTVPVAGPGSTSPEPEPEPEPNARPDLRLVSDAEIEAKQAADSSRRAAVRNLTSVLTFLNPIAIAPAELAEREYRAVLDEFEQADLDRAAETMAAIAAMKRGAR